MLSTVIIMPPAHVAKMSPHIRRARHRPHGFHTQGYAGKRCVRVSGTGKNQGRNGQERRAAHTSHNFKTLGDFRITFRAALGERYGLRIIIRGR